MSSCPNTMAEYRHNLYDPTDAINDRVADWATCRSTPARRAAEAATEYEELSAAVLLELFRAHVLNTEAAKNDAIDRILADPTVRALVDRMGEALAEVAADDLESGDED